MTRWLESRKPVLLIVLRCWQQVALEEFLTLVRAFWKDNSELDIRHMTLG